MDRGKLLVVHQGALGDFVVAFPAMQRLKARYAGIDVLSRSSHARLAVALGLADKPFTAAIDAIAGLFAGRPDRRIADSLSTYAGILLFSFSRDLETQFSNAARVPVHRIPPRPDPAQRVHVGAHLLRHLEHCGLVGETEKLRISAPAVRAEKLPARTVLVHPGSGSPKKMWPLERFKTAADQIESRGYRTEWLLGPAEREMAGLFSASDGRLHLVDDLMRLLELLRSAGGFVGNDSGVTHLAAFCGVPTVAVFGPSDPVRWRPVGPAVAIVTAGSDLPPCFETDPDSCRGGTYFKRILPSHVVAAFDRLSATG